MSKEKIIKIMAQKGQVTVSELTGSLGISRQAIHRILNKMIESGSIERAGTPPRVYYQLKEENKAWQGPVFDIKTVRFLENNYLNITPSGQVLKGVAGFTLWCESRGLDTIEMAKKYINISKSYKSLQDNGLLNATKKMKDTFPDSVLFGVFYHDFYSIEIFGKTKMGQMLLYSKISQDKKLINEVASIAKPGIEKLIKKFKIDGVIFVPPTVRREVQFMAQLERNLNLDVRKIEVLKIKTPVAVSQKTLSSLKDRVINARETFVIEVRGRYKNVLIIDDAVGSGATMNEIATKLKKFNVVDGNIFGYAITGSIKGFDVISEV